MITTHGQAEIDSFVASLVSERLDPEKSRAFATEIIRRAAKYKPATVAPHKLRQQLLAVSIQFDKAVAAIDSVRDETRHFDTANYLSKNAIRRPTRNIRLSQSNLWDSVLKKNYWPSIEQTPPIEALRAYLTTYAEAARSMAAEIKAPGRGKPPDFERYRPVLLCAAAWIKAFGKIPGKGKDSPFIRACRCALPRFGGHVPSSLDVHVRNALRGIDLKRLIAK
jgi:hypothetical protein